MYLQNFLIAYLTYALTIYCMEIFNYCIENSIFPTELKCADVSALHNKGETAKKNNYWPIRILPTISKVVERLCDKQLSAYITNYLSPLICGFRKDFSTQHALSRLLEKWKISLDSGGKLGDIFLDYQKLSNPDFMRVIILDIMMNACSPK